MSTTTATKRNAVRFVAIDTRVSTAEQAASGLGLQAQSEKRAAIDAPAQGDEAGGCSSVRRSAQGGCACAVALGCVILGLARRRRRIEAD